MFELLVSAVTGDLEGLAESVAPSVRLVHFGGQENVPDFKFDNGFFAKATWTVPRGRSFKYQGRMEIEGDLWLQKGSVMHVTEDLVMKNEDGASANPLKSCGKIVMEEGATLIVGGNLTCAGDPRFGSIWTCSPPTQVAPITSAIFVQGSATIPYGSFSATNLEDVAGAIEGMDTVADGLEVLFTDIGPNLSKIVGPFHTRAPYFASYATTFQLTIIQTPIGPIPIPTPIMLPKKNMLVPLFRALTMVYAGTLNVALGENLYTHADWWGFGEGVVPAMIKLNPAGPLKGTIDIDLDIKFDIDWDEYVTKLAETVLKDTAEFAIKQVGKKLVSQIMAAVAPAGGSIISSLLDEVFDAVAGEEKTFDDFRDEVLAAALGPVTDKLKGIARDLERQVTAGLKDAYMHEVGGPLIYAQSISVGEDGEEPLLMAGMLVAEENIDIKALSFVGSLTSFTGNVTARDVYFTPAFTRASLYKPKAAGAVPNAFARVVEVGYGNHFDSGEAVDIETGVWQVTTEGWSR